VVNEIKEVALGLTNEKTVSTYKARLMKKLNVDNMVDLLNRAKSAWIVLNSYNCIKQKKTPPLVVFLWCFLYYEQYSMLDFWFRACFNWM